MRWGVLARVGVVLGLSWATACGGLATDRSPGSGAGGGGATSTGGAAGDGASTGGAGASTGSDASAGGAAGSDASLGGAGAGGGGGVQPDAAPEAGDASEECGSGVSHACHVTKCQGHVYACGDCIDNDGDGLVDMDDPDCPGPCQNAEDGFGQAIPGAQKTPCVQDCYFDGDYGSGNDDCHWSHTCDPFAPEGAACPYDPSAGIAGTTAGCSDLQAAQSNTCTGYCGPLVPNGCDCFGCCEVPGASTPVWLGSTDGIAPTCSVATLGDPTKCHPCAIVKSCFNSCAHCELCLGKTTLPADCGPQQDCPAGEAPCGLGCQPSCPAGYYCRTGCCTPAPM